jgi:nucleotide-binding universal stress UspA family protein
VASRQEEILRFAAEAAMERRAPLRIVHCTEFVATSDPFATSMHPDLWKSAGEQVIDDAVSFVAGLSSVPTTNGVLRVAPPLAVLQAEAEGASLLVLGADHPTWAERMMGLRVTERIAVDAVVPVVVVPDQPSPARLDGVFVAVEINFASWSALRFAFVEATRRACPLFVVHVAPIGTAPIDLEQAQVDVAELLAGWSQEFPEVPVERRLLVDEADEACVRASEAAELLVIGQRVQGWLQFPFGHPVTAELIRRARCPVVVVPEGWKEEL